MSKVGAEHIDSSPLRYMHGQEIAQQMLSGRLLFVGWLNMNGRFRDGSCAVTALTSQRHEICSFHEFPVLELKANNTSTLKRWKTDA
jgi:hypothetical protein